MSFLQGLTSQQGKNLITGPSLTKVRQDGSPSWEHRWVDFSNEGETQRAIDQLTTECKGVYFALGSFAPFSGRQYRRLARCCTHLKALWLDIDCGEEKWNKHDGVGCYRTREDAQVAFTSFITSTGLPNPTYIVSSGAGYHIYWQFTEDVPIDKWRPVALLLKDICTRWQFKADPARTADASSVLRPVGTYHKSGAMVQIVSTGSEVTFEVMTQTLERLRPYILEPSYQKFKDTMHGLGTKPTFLQGEVSSLSKQELEVPKRFANIIAKSELENTGCGQIQYMYQNQEAVPEPMWTGALSIAKFCLDGGEWAIKISENHPDFDPDVTLRKMGQWDAPRTCLWFSQNNPDICKKCPHFRNVAHKPSQSPIMLAVDDQRVPVVVKEKLQTLNSELQTEEEFVIPSYPFPYYRNSQLGGIWRNVEDKDEDGSPLVRPVCVFDLDFYIYDRIGMGVDNKPRFWARLHTPHDGVCEIELSSDDVFSAPNTLPQRLASHNVLLPMETEVAEMYRYLRTQASQAQRARAMTRPPKQLGWTPNHTFVLGRWEFTKAGRKMSPIPDTNIARNFQEACELRRDCSIHLQDWNKALNALYGADDAGIYRLILAMGFGAPIRTRYGAEVGGVVNIYSEDSGFGKTTLTKVIAGIFSQSPEPFVLQAQHGTTVTAFFEIISYVNSLPLTLDEAGQMDIDSLMTFIHTCTSGRAKARGSAQVNDIRQSLPGWKTHVFSSSNVSIWNRITEARTENEAYLMRVIELPVRALKQSENKNYGDEAVRNIQKYYGVAGPLLLDYILQNEEDIEQMWRATSVKLTETCKLHGRHRFWGDIMTAGVVGAFIAHQAGVFPFNPHEVERTAIECLLKMKDRAMTKVVSDHDLLGDFLNSSIEDTMLIFDANISSTATKYPRSSYCAIRVEKQQQLMFIDTNAVREYAKDRQFGLERLEAVLEDMGGQRGIIKRMWDNTEYQGSNAPVRCWMIKLNSAEAQRFIRPEEIINAVEPSTNGEQA